MQTTKEYSVKCTVYLMHFSCVTTINKSSQTLNMKLFEIS